MKKCPYCAEDVQDEAIKCKHCGEYFSEKNVSGISKTETTTSETTMEKPTKNKKRPLWKTILMWLLTIWAALTLIGALMELFMFISIGSEINIGTMSVGLLALAILLKMGHIKYQK